jgi:hypothetical protein
VSVDLLDCQILVLKWGRKFEFLLKMKKLLFSKILTHKFLVCKRDSRFLANEFRLKFPTNLWRNGKETLLADLLAARLEDCFSKHESNHWKRVDELISGLSLAAT